MKTRPARRFGILVLALALVPGQLSTADAGVIPWLYDAVFGPVGHYGGGYGGGYGYGVPSTYSYYRGPGIGYAVPPSSNRSSNCGPVGCGPAGCATAPYRVSYSPFFGVPRLCPTGGCTPVLTGYRYSSGNCGSCATVACAKSTCDAQTAWKSNGARTEWSTEVVDGEAAVPTPVTAEEAPRPKKTFNDEPADPSKAQPNSVGKVVIEDTGGITSGGKPGPGDAQPATAGEETSAGFSATLREDDATDDDQFKKPIPGTEPEVNDGAAPTKTQQLPENLPEDTDGSPATESAPGLDINLPLELENQSSWKVEFPVRRIAFRAGFGRAKVARTSVSVNADYVVPTTVAMRLVSR